MQAATAWVLYTGVRAGAVVPGPYTYGSIALAAAGGVFCCYQAATASSTQQWEGSVASSAAGSVLSGSITGDGQRVLAPPAGGFAVWGADQFGVRGSNNQQHAGVRLSPAGAAAVSAAAAAECSEGVPLSSAECEKREHAEPEYAAFTNAAVLLLTLLQLAL